MPLPLDVPSLKRPDFTPGREITLADGQKWTFPLPVIELVPDDKDDVRFLWQWWKLDAQRRWVMVTWWCRGCSGRTARLLRCCRRRRWWSLCRSRVMVVTR